MNKIIFIIGASGAGKTSTLKNLQERYPNDFEYCYFDSVGVPTELERIAKFGSGGNWQKETTKDWVRKIKENFLDSKNVILDGQIRPEYIVEACAENSIENYEVILFDCSDEKRKERLIEREQPELETENMANWAKFLRNESIARGYRILDNSNFNREQTIQELLKVVKPVINGFTKELGTIAK